MLCALAAATAGLASGAPVAPARAPAPTHTDLRDEVRELVGMPGGPPGRTTIVAFINTNNEHKGSAPSTLLGEAITRVISPRHVYTLAAAPTTDDE
jgi:hypothetical protein